jgi:hypothetical protein
LGKTFHQREQSFSLSIIRKVLGLSDICLYLLVGFDKLVIWMLRVEVVTRWGKCDLFVFKNVGAHAAVMEAVHNIQYCFYVGSKHQIFAVKFIAGSIQAAVYGLAYQRTLILPCSELNSESLKQLKKLVFGQGHGHLSLLWCDDLLAVHSPIHFRIHYFKC